MQLDKLCEKVVFEC